MWSDIWNVLYFLVVISAVFNLWTLIQYKRRPKEAPPDDRVRDLVKRNFWQAEEIKRLQREVWEQKKIIEAWEKEKVTDVE